jgi:hypothetical protein
VCGKGTGIYNEHSLNDYSSTCIVNFLSEKFLELAQSKFHEKNCIVVTSGGFEGENKDKTFGSSPEKGIFEISHLSADHEEGDTRVWFHASKSTANRLIIYSPDTDTFFIISFLYSVR